MEHTFSHLDAQGNVTMVDVGDKAPSKRVAIAEAVVELAPATLELLKKSALPKGDVLACANVFVLLFIRRIKRLKRLQPSEVFFIFLRCPLATIEMQRACQNDN